MDSELDSRYSPERAVHQFESVGQFLGWVFARRESCAHEGLGAFCPVDYLREYGLVKLDEICAGLLESQDLVVQYPADFVAEIFYFRVDLVGQAWEPT